jgi:glycosyltransferase involved in cell wall biosynthesis
VPNNRTTILQIIPELDAGGAEQSVVETVCALVRARARALVLAQPGGRLTSALAAAGGEIIAFPAATKNPLRMLANARAIAQLAIEERAHLIHARSRAPAWSALMAARRARLPFVTTYHGAYNETNALKRAYNSVMARGDVVIANSQYTAGLIASRYHTAQERIAVIHRGVDAARFDPARIAPDRTAALRQAWGVATHEPIILQAARLTSWKGQTVLIDAVSRLRSRGVLPDAVVVLAGGAQGREGYRATLQSRIQDLGLASCVRLVGHVQDMAAAFAAAHVTVIASTEPEAFGRTAIEAAAVCCPVIATNIGATLETVLAQPRVPGDGTTGWLVPPNDAEALAAALAEALALAPKERTAMGERARRHVLAHFTTETMQRRTLAVYDRLLGTALEGQFGSNTPQHNSLTASGQRP